MNSLVHTWPGAIYHSTEFPPSFISVLLFDLPNDECMSEKRQFCWPKSETLTIYCETNNEQTQNNTL